MVASVLHSGGQNDDKNSPCPKTHATAVVTVVGEMP